MKFLFFCTWFLKLGVYFSHILRAHEHMWVGAAILDSCRIDLASEHLMGIASGVRV